MPDHDPTADRLREELHAISTPLVDVEGLLTAGRRRARRRAVRKRAVAGIGGAGLAAVVAIAVLPDDAPDAVTESQSVPAATSAPLPDGVPLGQGTTWPGGPFDPIDGMVDDPAATLLTHDEAATVHDAEQRATAACMARHGFAWGSAVAGDSAGTLPLYLSPDELRAGGLDYEYDWEAAADAFLDTFGDAAPATESRTEDEEAAYEAALFGTPPQPEVSIETADGTVSASGDGCIGEARTRVYGSVSNALRWEELREAFGGVSGRLRRHDEYRRPLADWQACMGEAGFAVGENDYGASWIQQAAAAALYGEGRDQAQVTAQTISAVARADADCQESSGLYDVRESLLADVTAEIADDLGIELDHYIAYARAVYARARQIP